MARPSRHEHAPLRVAVARFLRPLASGDFAWGIYTRTRCTSTSSEASGWTKGVIQRAPGRHQHSRITTQILELVPLRYTKCRSCRTSLGEAAAGTKATDPARRETLRVRPGHLGLRGDPKWLVRIGPTLCIAPKLNDRGCEVALAALGVRRLSSPVWRDGCRRHEQEDRDGTRK